MKKIDFTWINVADKFGAPKPKYGKINPMFRNIQAYSFGDPYATPRFEEDKVFVSECQKKQAKEREIDSYFTEELTKTVMHGVNLRKRHLRDAKDAKMRKMLYGNK